MHQHSASAAHKPQSSIEAGELVAAATASAPEGQEEEDAHTPSVTDEQEEISETADIQDDVKEESGEAEVLKQAHSPIFPPAS